MLSARFALTLAIVAACASAWCFDLHDNSDTGCISTSTEICEDAIDACTNFGAASIRLECAANSSTSAWTLTSYTAANCPTDPAQRFGQVSGVGNGCYDGNATIGGYIDVRCDETVGDGNNEANCGTRADDGFVITHDLHGASDPTCIGDSQNRTSRSGECITLGGTSILVQCDEQSASSNWSYAVFRNPCCNETELESRCFGTADTCTNCPGLSGFHASVNCTAGPPLPGCFSDDAEVTLEDGTMKRLADVRVGDRVLAADTTGALFFDRVFRVTHHSDYDEAEFLRVRTASGRSLELTANHYVHGGSCCSYDSMVMARDLRVGHTLYTEGKDGLVPDKVVAIEREIKAGVYNAHTIHGNIVVSGVAASHFTTQSLPTSSAAYAVTPMWHRIVDAYGSIFGAEDQSTA